MSQPYPPSFGQINGPQIQIRRSEDRGHGEHRWLKSYHTFSFADYFDPHFMNFRTLRVINEDWIQPGKGFAQHPHRDMEILTYVIQGELQHKDSMGHRSVIHPAMFQRMSAGTGVQHSEYNLSSNDVLHLLQIWIVPQQKGLTPTYEQKLFPEKDRVGKLTLIASQDGRQNSLQIHQNVNLFSAILDPRQTIVDRLSHERFGWLQMVRGILSLNGELLKTGDGASLVGGGSIEFHSPVQNELTEFLLFDLS